MLRYAVALMGVLGWGAAGAAMVIDRAVIDFAADAPPRQDVLVANPDEQPLFVDIQVLDVRNPGTEEEARVPVRDPEAIGLIATPRRLMVPAGGQRLVRLVNLNGHGDSERVYRVNLKPVSGPVESEQMGVRVMVGYQLLVFVAPEQARVSLDAERRGKRLHLRNDGNVNVRLFQGRQCPGGMSREADCVELKGRRLYPGNDHVIKLPYDAPVEFSVMADGKSSRRRFD